MNLKKLLFTNNACYKEGKQMTPKGIMIHSTGANNPYLKRYVGPDDGLLGVNKYGNHWNRTYPDNIEICVHGFIGKLANETIATYQTLPWDMVGWHSGSGVLGSKKNANNTGFIGFEICEDDLCDKVYFDKVYKEAVELCVYLCERYGIAVENVICHSEGNKMGIASAHSDVMHWFPKYGKSMDTFRKDVEAGLVELKKTTETDGERLYRVQVGAFKSKANATNYAKKLKCDGYDCFEKRCGDFYRVQVGAFKNKANAEKFLAGVRKDGYVDSFMIEG